MEVTQQSKLHRSISRVAVNAELVPQSPFYSELPFGEAFLPPQIKMGG